MFHFKTNNTLYDVHKGNMMLKKKGEFCFRTSIISSYLYDYQQILGQF